jgi:hypothetical protein
VSVHLHNVARQRLGKHVLAAMNTRNNIIVGCVIFYEVRVISKESRRLVLHRTSCLEYKTAFLQKMIQYRVNIQSWTILLHYKKFWEELIAYFPRYDTGHIENDVYNNSTIVARVFVTAVTFLPSRCLATIRRFLTSCCLATIRGFLPSRCLATIWGIHRHTHTQRQQRDLINLLDFSKIRKIGLKGSYKSLRTPNFYLLYGTFHIFPKYCDVHAVRNMVFVYKPLLGNHVTVVEWWWSLPAEKSCSCSYEGERALQSRCLALDVPANMEAEDPTVLEDGNQATVNGPSRVTVLVRRPVSTCQRVNRRTRLRQQQ